MLYRISQIFKGVVQVPFNSGRVSYSRLTAIRIGSGVLPPAIINLSSLAVENRGFFVIVDIARHISNFKDVWLIVKRPYRGVEDSALSQVKLLALVEVNGNRTVVILSQCFSVFKRNITRELDRPDLFTD